MLLNFLWRQWSALGVAGHSRSDDPWIIDPEALLLFTCTLGRHEPRLFDEVIDWLQVNGPFINILRLKRILRTEKFAGGRVLAAVAGLMSKGAEVLKWKKLAESAEPAVSPEGSSSRKTGRLMPIIGDPDPHFARYGLKRGPLRLRGYSQTFRPTAQTNLLPQLRALFGINVRCEIVLYLLTHEAAHPSQIARDSYYFSRAVQNALVDMSRSGIVQLRSAGREKNYWLKPEHWAVLLNRDEELRNDDVVSLNSGLFARWITWPPLFRALERIWSKLTDAKLMTLDPLLQSSEVRQLIIEVRPSIERAGFDKALSDDRQYLSEKYLPVFLSDITRLLVG